MDPPTDQDRVSWQVVAFAARYVADRAAGSLRPLGDYLEMFPGDPDGIAGEFARLEREHDTAADGGSDGWQPGETVGSFRLVREIGRGGQARVWLAEDEKLGRPVALKALDLRGFEREAALRRLEREARTVAGLRHPAICPVYGLERTGDVAWLVMRYVDGETVARRLERVRREREARGGGAAGRPAVRPDDPDAVRSWVRFMAAAARAVDAAHAARLVHRDLKPSNLMIDEDGRPVILDFGLVQQAQPDSVRLTRPGEVFGTYAYMAPEQIVGDHARVGPNTDVWALGATLYECLTLRPAFDAPSHAALAQRILEREPMDPRRLNRLVDRDLAVIVATALDKDPARRYGTAGRLADDLERWLGRRPVAARPAGPWLRFRRMARRHPLPTISVSLTIVVLAAGLISSLHLLGESRAAEAAALREQRRADRGYGEMTRVLGSLLGGLGDAAVRYGESPGLRLELSRKLIASLERMPPEDHDAVARARLLGQAHVAAGDALAFPYLPSLDRPADALRHYRAAVAVTEEAARAAPRDRGLHHVLGMAHLRSAILVCMHEEDHDAARDAALAGLRAFRSAEDPDVPERTRVDVAHALEILAFVERSTGAHEAALERLQETLRLKQELLDARPGSFKRRRDLALITSKVGSALHACGRKEEAQELMREGLRLTRELADDHDERVIVWADLRNAYRKLSSVLAAVGERAVLESAAGMLGEAVEAGRTLVARTPGNDAFRENLARDLEDQARLLRPLRRSGEVRRLRAEAMRVRADSERASVEQLLDAARLLLTARPADLRDPGAAYAYARRAAARSDRGYVESLVTLAEAALATGRPSVARQAAEEALALEGEGAEPATAERLERVRERLDGR